jgi:hypothetical protein
MEPRARAESVWYRTAGLATRNRKDLAVDIIESEIRSAMHEVWLEAAKLVLTENEPIEIARQFRDRRSERFGHRLPRAARAERNAATTVLAAPVLGTAS